jgi:hypothetical protein
MQIVKLAFRGEVEHGVDIAAVREESNDVVLYLIQIKAGNIDKTLWDSGPNAIRPTLNNLLDVPFKDLTQVRLREAKKQAVLAHNGTLRENIRSRFNGYVKDVFKPRMDFDRWDLDRLADWFYEHLLNERLLPPKYQRQFKRTLVFLDVPDYDLGDFKGLLREVLPDIKYLRKSKRIRVFGFVRLMLAMIRQRCQEPALDDLSPAVTAYEQALLSTWGWMYRKCFFGKAVLDEFAQTYLQYIDLLIKWSNKIAPAVSCPEGLAFGGTSERIEYPMRTFRVIGNLGFLATALAYLPDSDLKIRHLTRTIELLHRAILHNPARHRPLLDNHSIDIFLGMWPLLLTGHAVFVSWWLQDILEHLVIRKRFCGRLPELTNDIDAVIEYEASGERPVGYTDSSSTLIYLLFELCLLLDAEDLYSTYREAFEDVNFQVWYPPENVEEILYSREVFEGSTEIVHGLPDDFEEFRSDVQARHQFDRTDYSPVKKGLPIVILLANKHFRTPVFPFWWREMMFSSLRDGESNDDYEERINEHSQT